MNDKAALIAVICGALGLLMIFAEITGHGKKDKSSSSSVIVNDITTTSETTTDTTTDTTTNTSTTTETIIKTAEKPTTTAKITTSKETTTTSNTTTTTDTPTETTTTTETIDAITDKQYDDYVLNTSTMKYHIPSCSSVGDIAPENRQDVYTTSADLEAQGYEPCGRCKPR